MVLIKTFGIVTAVSAISLNAALADELRMLEKDDLFAGGAFLDLAETPMSESQLQEARGGFSVGGLTFNIGVTVTPPSISPPFPDGGPLPNGPFGDDGGPLPNGPFGESGSPFGDDGGPLPNGPFGDSGGPGNSSQSQDTGPSNQVVDAAPPAAPAPVSAPPAAPAAPAPETPPPVTPPPAPAPATEAPPPAADVVASAPTTPPASTAAPS
ncbi:MAG: hypothetical protein AAFW68_14470, partial [Pseudomonadota bacterium]